MSELVIWGEKRPVSPLPGCFFRCLLWTRLALYASFWKGVLGLPHFYVEERIQTLLLNGLAVDDPDTAVLESGARLALSAAMPGVLGATLRRGGACICGAALRLKRQARWSGRKSCVGRFGWNTLF